MHRFNLIALATLSTVRIAAAHPGHGDPGRGSGLAHHLTEPAHILFLFALVIGLVALKRLVWERWRTRD
ncbi:hypothetical protein H8E07_20945 [bacterium]|nr:hypothetical protein [bacterium]